MLQFTCCRYWTTYFRLFVLAGIETLLKYHMVDEILRSTRTFVLSGYECHIYQGHVTLTNLYIFSYAYGAVITFGQLVGPLESSAGDVIITWSYFQSCIDYRHKIWTAGALIGEESMIHGALTDLDICNYGWAMVTRFVDTRQLLQRSQLSSPLHVLGDIIITRSCDFVKSLCL